MVCVQQDGALRAVSKDEGKQKDDGEDDMGNEDDVTTNDPARMREQPPAPPVPVMQVESRRPDGADRYLSVPMDSGFERH